MRYVAIDFETGNASPLSACSLGVSVFEDETQTCHEASLIRPPDEVGAFHWGNVKINGIRRNMVEDAPDFPAIWARYAALVENSVLVCHNAVFDTAVLCRCLSYYGLPMPNCRYVCTVKVSQRVWPEFENHKLDTVSAALGIPLDHHEAGSDAEAAGRILLAALRKTGSCDAQELAHRIGMQLGTISNAGRKPCSIAARTTGKNKTPLQRSAML